MLDDAGHLSTECILSADLDVSGITAFCTLRFGGVSSSPFNSWNMGAHVGDNPADVAKNRQLLRKFLVNSIEPKWLQQVHGIRVIAAHNSDCNEEADGAWTNQPGVPCVVMTADCLPVVFAATDGSAVAVAHAGWRGLASGVIESVITALPVAPERLSVWLGPAIGPDVFEVGEEVLEAFLNATFTDVTVDSYFRPARYPGKYLADLYGLVRLHLQAFGVGQITGGDRCTVSESKCFFSYRRESITGRMATVVMINAD